MSSHSDMDLENGGEHQHARTRFRYHAQEISLTLTEEKMRGRMAPQKYTNTQLNHYGQNSILLFYGEPPDGYHDKQKDHFYSYQTTTKIWQRPKTHNPPPAREGHIIFSRIERDTDFNTIYLFGGGVYDEKESTYHLLSGDLYKYTIPIKSWSVVSTKNTKAGMRFNHACYFSPVFDTCYTFGGRTATDKYSKDLHCLTFTEDGEDLNLEWDLIINDTHGKDKAPSTREACSFAGTDDYLICYGGYNKKNDKETIMKDVWELSFDYTEWKKLKIQMPAQYGHSATIIRGLMFVFGGINEESKYRRSVLMLDIKRLFCVELSYFQVHCGIMHGMTAVSRNLNKTDVYLFAGEIDQNEDSDSDDSDTTIPSLTKCTIEMMHLLSVCDWDDDKAIDF